MTTKEYIKWLKFLDEELPFDGLVDGDEEVDLHEMIYELCEFLEQNVKIGKWIIKRVDGYDHAICSVCGDDSYLLPEWDALELYKYCPNCGIKMQEVEV